MPPPSPAAVYHIRTLVPTTPPPLTLRYYCTHPSSCPVNLCVLYTRITVLVDSTPFTPLIVVIVRIVPFTPFYVYVTALPRRITHYRCCALLAFAAFLPPYLITLLLVILPCLVLLYWLICQFCRFHYSPCSAGARYRCYLAYLIIVPLCRCCYVRYLPCLVLYSLRAYFDYPYPPARSYCYPPYCIVRVRCCCTFTAVVLCMPVTFSCLLPTFGVRAVGNRWGEIPCPLLHCYLCVGAHMPPLHHSTHHHIPTPYPTTPHAPPTLCDCVPIVALLFPIYTTLPHLTHYLPVLMTFPLFCLVYAHSLLLCPLFPLYCYLLPHLIWKGSMGRWVSGTTLFWLGVWFLPASSPHYSCCNSTCLSQFIHSPTTYPIPTFSSAFYSLWLFFCVPVPQFDSYSPSPVPCPPVPFCCSLLVV